MSGGDPFSPQGPRTPHGYGSGIAIAIVAVLFAACVLTLVLLAVGVLER